MWKKGGSSTVLFLFSQVSSCIYASHLRFQPSHMIVCLAYEHCHLVVISKALIYTYKQGSLSRFGGHEKLWVITQLLRLKLHVWALKHQITELHISSWYSNISEFCKKFDFFSKITTYTNLQPKKKLLYSLSAARLLWKLIMKLEYCFLNGIRAQFFFLCS